MAISAYKSPDQSHCISGNPSRVREVSSIASVAVSSTIYIAG